MGMYLFIFPGVPLRTFTISRTGCQLSAQSDKSTTNHITMPDGSVVSLQGWFEMSS